MSIQEVKNALVKENNLAYISRIVNNKAYMSARLNNGIKVKFKVPCSVEIENGSPACFYVQYITGYK